jgi:hypothetical protein
VDDTPGVSEIQYNTRMLTANELQRRWGHQSSSIAQQAGAVLGIVAANGASGNFLTFDLGSPSLGTLVGINPPPDQPPGPKRRRPAVAKGTPAPPVIVSITATPPSAAYVAGNILMTAVIAYDGLSGPLIYDWDVGYIGPGVPTIVDDTVNPATYDFNAGCTPAVYTCPGTGLTVSTTLNGFSVTASLPNFTVT